MMSSNQLKIRVVEARDLAKADFFGLSDPYCELRVVSMYPTRETVKKTRVIRNTLCPTWNEEFFFTILHPREDQIEIKVYDWDAASTNDLLGSVTVPVSGLFGTGHTDEWRELHDPHHRAKKGRGTLHIICDYTGEGRVTAAPAMPYGAPMQTQYAAPPPTTQYPQYAPPQQYAPPAQYAQYPPAPQAYPQVYGYTQPQMMPQQYAGYPPAPAPYGYAPGPYGYAAGYPPRF